jgi:hypothetical protein
MISKLNEDKDENVNSEVQNCGTDEACQYYLEYLNILIYIYIYVTYKHLFLNCSAI